MGENNLNHIINKIKCLYKYSAYIDKNNNENYNIDYEINQKIINEISESLNALVFVNAKNLKNKSIIIDPPKCNFNVNYNNIEIGICEESFTNKNKDKIDIEFHVKQLDPDTELKALEQLEEDYEDKINILPLSDLLNIEEQIGQFVIDHFYLGILMVFVNEKYIDGIHSFFKRNQGNQLKLIGNQLISEYKQKYL